MKLSIFCAPDSEYDRSTKSNEEASLSVTTEPSVKTLNNYVNGSWVEALGAAMHPVLNPATGETIAEVPFSTAGHLDDTGQRVPEDLAIVGYDDIAFAASAAVPLTSVRQPRQSLGRTAAELLIDEVNNPEHLHQTVEFTPELIARTSTLG